MVVYRQWSYTSTRRGRIAWYGLSTTPRLPRTLVTLGLTDRRWEAFSKTAAQHGILSTISLPLDVRDEVVGALNMYSRREAGFGEDDEEIGMLFATQAAVVLANANAYWDARQLSENLTE